MTDATRTDPSHIARVADALAGQHAARARYEPLAGDLAISRRWTS